MKKKLIILISSVMIITSCSIFEKETLSGEWQLNLIGDYQQTFSLFVDEDYSFNQNAVVNMNGREYDIKITGMISEDGSMMGKIYAMGQQVGELTGKVNYETGEGKWAAAGLGGIWTSSKKS
ncbi:MAG: hypothetical protein JW995_09810 [Melioribacteraceae bacterium]|nr:hypothetical protein [Melioribacteraceae bacterium]